MTTAARPDSDLEAAARALASGLGLAFLPRLPGTLPEMAQRFAVPAWLVVERGRLRLFHAPSGTEYAYHPNMLPVRARSVAQGQPDLFVQAMELRPGDAVLDCTLGFGTEATLAAWLVGGTGRVVGLESVPALAAVTRAGMQSPPPSLSKVLIAAMRRVHVVTADHVSFLRECAAGTFDQVYFDPFFDERLPGSEGSVSPLACFGNASPLSVHAVQEARRVARRRVVIKSPKREALPPAIAAGVSESVTVRRSRMVYSVLLPLVPAPPSSGTGDTPRPPS